MRCAALLVCLLLPLAAQAQVNGQVLSDDRNDDGHGVSVVYLHGSHYEMGYAHGWLLAERIEVVVEEARTVLGGNYDLLRGYAPNVDWVGTGFDDEVDGIVAGVLAALPSADIDVTDIRVINGMGEWGYLCRSHASWGSRNALSGVTLMTRRLDYGTPFESQHDHVIFAQAPEDGGSDYVNFAWPGFITVVTGVNENGVMVSLHDYNSGSGTSDPFASSRAAVARYGLVEAWPGEVSTHAGSFFDALDGLDILTGSFINFYAPDGGGGVITCERESGCHTLREPQASYYGGEVIMTTNDETTGTSTPGGGEFMATYYDDSTLKTRLSHFELMGDYGLHLVTAEYHGPAEINLMFMGDLPMGDTGTVELTWSELFEAAVCGNGVVDSGEICDGAALDGNDCTTVAGDFIGGTLGCNGTCDGWELGACTSGGDTGGSGGSAGSGGGGGDSGDPGGGCAATGGPVLGGAVFLVLALRHRARRARSAESR